MADPVKGTGKKPKGSGRRLYTDENPKDTVSIKFATPADARATCAKVKRISKPYARKIQILTVVEQRSKAAGKRQQAAIAKRCKMALKRKHGKMIKSRKGNVRKIVGSLNQQIVFNRKRNPSYAKKMKCARNKAVARLKKK